MDLQHLTSDLVTGDPLPQSLPLPQADPPPRELDPAVVSLILSQLQRELDAETLWQNHSISSSSVGLSKMKEVREFAGGIRESVADLKKLMNDARGHFDNEVARGKINASKVKSLAIELKEANQEVESFLGETDSNFPPSEASNTPQVSGSTAARAGFEPMHADRNGVTINKDNAA